MKKKNIGLQRFLIADETNFTSDIGMKVRKILNPLIRRLLPLGMKRKINKQELAKKYPKLNKKEAYIFASSHSFTEDIIAGIVAIDRPCYVLLGTTDQLMYNRLIYAAWAIGFIYVDKSSEASKKNSILKMERVIKNGISVLIFPEGALNNTEELPIGEIRGGVYSVAEKTGAKVVPLSSFNEMGKKNITFEFGNPRDITKLPKKESLELLRSEMGLLNYYNIKKSASKFIREDIDAKFQEENKECKIPKYVKPTDEKLKFMEQRRDEYHTTKWTKNVGSEELPTRKDPNKVHFHEVYENIDKIKITRDNARILAPILARMREYEKEQKYYNFQKYMDDKWVTK